MHFRVCASGPPIKHLASVLPIGRTLTASSLARLRSTLLLGPCSRATLLPGVEFACSAHANLLASHGLLSAESRLLGSSPAPLGGAEGLLYRPPLMSTLSSSYSVVDASAVRPEHSRPLDLPRKVANELVLLAALSPTSSSLTFRLHGARSSSQLTRLILRELSFRHQSQRT